MTMVGACATTVQDGGNLRLKVLDATSDRPSNVALHLSVDNKAGEPVEGLKPSNFRIFEDGKLIPEDKAKRLLLDPKAAEEHITLLLVDLSGPIVESPTFPELVTQIGQFMAHLKPAHQLTVSLFDGRDDLLTVLEPNETDLDKALARVRRYRPEDRKGNLNGAVLKALAILDKQLAGSSAGHKVSNLVVFTDRGDLAEKVPAEELDIALDKTPADVYVIAVGPGIKRPELGKIARTDAFYSTSTGDLEVGFTHLSKHLEGGAAGQYLLSYCSPKRKGEHKLEIEIVTEKEHGALSHTFNADGFGKGCSPASLPAFVAAKSDDQGEEAAQGQAEATPADKDQPAGNQQKSGDKSGDKSGKVAEAKGDALGDEKAGGATEAEPAAEPGAVAASATTATHGKTRPQGKAGRKPESKPDPEGKTDKED
jgi:hypothetical protein